MHKAERRISCTYYMMYNPSWGGHGSLIFPRKDVYTRIYSIYYLFNLILYRTIVFYVRKITQFQHNIYRRRPPDGSYAAAMFCKAPLFSPVVLKQQYNNDI